MKRTFIDQLQEKANGTVKLQGFVETVRDLKSVVFVVLQDPKGSVQLVFEKSNAALAAQAASLTRGSAITIIGEVRLSPQVKLNQVEVAVAEMEIVSVAEAPLPIEPESALDLRMDYRWIDLRRPRNRVIFKVQTQLEKAMRGFWAQNGFFEIHSPKLMPGASEGGAELFTMPYFELGEAALAQSPQFYKQMAMAAGFDKVFEIGPVFRANPSFTPRHDTEFTSVDMEIAWIDSHEDVMSVEEEWLRHCLMKIKMTCSAEIREYFGAEIIPPATPFPRIPLEEARAILAREFGKIVPEDDDLDPEGERLLSQYVLKEHGHEFVFVTDYPINKRPFYHMRYPDRPTVTKSFDLLWKGLEVTTGAQREHRLDILTAQAMEKGIDPESIRDYLNFFRYGVPPHGGGGIGLTRLLMVMLNISNVREVTYLYRGPTRLRP